MNIHIKKAISVVTALLLTASSVMLPQFSESAEAYSYKVIKVSNRKAEKFYGKKTYWKNTEAIFEDEASVNTRLIVRFKNNTSNSEIKKYNADEFAYDKADYTCIMQFSSAKEANQAMTKLEKSGDIDYVEKDVKICIPEDKKVWKKALKTGSMSASAYNNYLSWGPERIGADDFIDSMSSSAKTRTITVAVIDTGVDSNHSFLSGKVLSGYNAINGGTNTSDGQSHGTHVAGIIADTTLGCNIKILPVKVLDDSGNGTNATVATGIKWATSHGADIINLSLGGYDYSSSDYLDTAVNAAIQAGVTVCIAAGNDNGSTDYFCPAHTKDAITVAAVDSSDTKAYFSNYGKAVDVASPGVDIYSSIPGGKYEYMSGTSMATPFVSAAAALLKADNYSLKPADIANLLISSADDRGATGYDYYYGYGVINLSKLAGNSNGNIPDNNDWYNWDDPYDYNNGNNGDNLGNEKPDNNSGGNIIDDIDDIDSFLDDIYNDIFGGDDNIFTPIPGDDVIVKPDPDDNPVITPNPDNGNGNGNGNGYNYDYGNWYDYGNGYDYNYGNGYDFDYGNWDWYDYGNGNNYDYGNGNNYNYDWGNNGGYTYVPDLVSFSSSISTNGSGGTLTIVTSDITKLTITIDGKVVSSNSFTKNGTTYTYNLSKLGKGNHTYTITGGGSSTSGSFTI